MSGTRQTPAEQHLGDRLAALVDGELKHDARERVLAHLATCPKCKAECDAQRRLKNAFASAPPPSPSEGFLARLQGLPGGPGGDDGGPRGPFGPEGRFGERLFPMMRPPGGPGDMPPAGSPLDGFGYLPAVHGSTAVLPGAGSRPGFRIHEVGREPADRSPWRGRRFAFAAASAVSLAAIALGGALPRDSGPAVALSSEGAGSSATPIDADPRSGSGSAAASRHAVEGGALAAGGDAPHPGGDAPHPGGDAPHPGGAVSPPAAVSSAQPLRGATTSSLLSTANLTGQLTGHAFALPVLNVSPPPLIRPVGFSPLLSAATGGGAKPNRAEPSATASAFPSLADQVLPLSPRS